MVYYFSNLKSKRYILYIHSICKEGEPKEKLPPGGGRVGITLMHLQATGAQGCPESTEAVRGRKDFSFEPLEGVVPG